LWADEYYFNGDGIDPASTIEDPTPAPGVSAIPIQLIQPEAFHRISPLAAIPQWESLLAHSTSSTRQEDNLVSRYLALRTFFYNIPL
jgi:hypothetical protein